jgi:hypothetical protein
VKKSSYREYLIAATQDFDLRFACFSGESMPSGKQDSEVQGKIDKLWIGSLISGADLFDRFGTFFWNVADHH